MQIDINVGLHRDAMHVLFAILQVEMSLIGVQHGPANGFK